MIKLQELTPKVYNNQSRDFQLLSRLYDLVLNSVKANADLIYNYPINDNTNQSLIDLMSLTLGFSSKHNYNLTQLTALCNSFTYIIKYKGSIEGIITACNALVSSEGISNVIEYELNDNNTVLTLYIPQEVSDTNLLKDLLVYILPVGMSCNIVKEVKLSKPANSDLGFVSEDVKASTYRDENIGQKSKLFVPTDKDIEEVFENNKLNNTAGIIGTTTIVKPQE